TPPPPPLPRHPPPPSPPTIWSCYRSSQPPAATHLSKTSCRRSRSTLPSPTRPTRPSPAPTSAFETASSSRLRGPTSSSCLPLPDTPTITYSSACGRASPPSSTSSAAALSAPSAGHSKFSRSGAPDINESNLVLCGYSLVIDEWDSIHTKRCINFHCFFPFSGDVMAKLGFTSKKNLKKVEPKQI
ncbi:hypothetical protein PHJA_000325200, partial [Phtheirospermum japonicum]